MVGDAVGLALFLRLLLFAWAVHFWDLRRQVALAGGRHGYSPVGAQLGAVAAGLDGGRSVGAATCWLDGAAFARSRPCSGGGRRRVLRAVPTLGIACCAVGCIGYGSRWMFVFAWLIYHSLDVVFFDGFAYPWQNLMFEVGFLSAFAPPLVPWKNEVEWTAQPNFVSVLVVYAYRWLLFRLMFGFGKTKFIDDKDTTDNAMYIKHFLYAQPMPNKLAMMAVDKLPSWKWLWGAKVWFMWFAEIPVPFLALTPWRWLAAAIIPMLQVGIMMGGCFGQFNVLTSILCLPLLVEVPPPTADTASAPSLFLAVAYACFAVYLFATLVCVAGLNSGTTQMWSYYCELTRELFPSFGIAGSSSKGNKTLLGCVSGKILQRVAHCAWLRPLSAQ